MPMNEALTEVLAGLAGAALGVIFFGGLWWTVRRGVLSGHPARWFLGSGLVRVSVVIGGFYFVGGGQWQRLAGALAGFMVARFVVLGLTRPARDTPPPPEEARHAP
jgi:F1F0 ATPase subunit 2